MLNANRHLTALAFWVPLHLVPLLILAPESGVLSLSHHPSSPMELGTQSAAKPLAVPISTEKVHWLSDHESVQPINPIERTIKDTKNLSRDQIETVLAKYAETASEKNTIITLALMNGVSSRALGSRYLFHDLTGRENICIDAESLRPIGMGRYTIPASHDSAESQSLLAIARRTSTNGSAQFSGQLFIDTRVEIEMQRSLYRHIAPTSESGHLEPNMHYHATVALEPLAFSWTQTRNPQ